MKAETLLLGLPQVPKDLKGLENQHLMPHKLQQTMRAVKLTNKV